jgi:hypothetical protein
MIKPPFKFYASKYFTVNSAAAFEYVKRKMILECGRPAMELRDKWFASGRFPKLNYKHDGFVETSDPEDVAA